MTAANSAPSPFVSSPVLISRVPSLESRAFEFCSGLVDLVVCVGRHGGGGHRCALAGQRFVDLVAENFPQVGDRGVDPGVPCCGERPEREPRDGGPPVRSARAGRERRRGQPRGLPIVMVLPYFVAYTAAMSRAVTADRPAVHRPRPPRRGGGGCRWLLLRHGHGQRSGGETGGGLGHPDRAALHRTQQPRRCGGGCRQQRLCHRQWQQSGGKTGGGVMRRTAGARGRRASPTEAPLRVRKQHEGRARGARLSGRV